MPGAAELEEGTKWYEVSLPSEERKKRGHFSTPPLLVEKMLDACGYVPSANLGQIRVLDPACGSGNFLTGAARRLITSVGGQCIAPNGCGGDDFLSHLQRNLWGFDPDPISCFLAEMQLRAVCEDATGYPVPEETQWHIHQGDGLAMAWEPCFDLFLANPPYLAAKNTDLSGYRRAERGGQVDSYLLFLDVALQAVRPCGWMGLVLPDPLLARINAARERTRLLADCTIHHLWHLSGVFRAEVGAVVLIAQKNAPSKAHYVSWVRGYWKHVMVEQENGRGGPGQPQGSPLPYTWSRSNSGGVMCGAILQGVLLRQPQRELRYLLSTERGLAVERLRMALEEQRGPERKLAPLGEFVTIHRGEEYGKESCQLMQYPEGEEVGAWYPVLRGGVDMRPYGSPVGHWYMAQQGIKKPLERYLAPKLLVVKSTGILQAALDLEGHVVLQTLYVLNLRGSMDMPAQEDELYFLLALLNSRLLRTYVAVLHTVYKWVQPQLEQHILARLPAPVMASPLKAQIIGQARALSRACGEMGAVVEWGEDRQNLYEEQERTICALYATALPELFS